jgi:hypothetical protein
MESGLDNSRSHEILRESMKEPEKLTSQELFRMAANPDVALLVRGGEGKTIEMRPGNGSAPRKRRKMSAAWEVMIAITEKSRRGKGERIALQGRRERGGYGDGATCLDKHPAGGAPCPEI